MLNDKTILITGGTGSFGRQCTETVLSRYRPKKLIIFSRDELKQYEMAQVYGGDKYGCMRYFLGDVRDKERLDRALSGVDYVIHAAALKQVPAAEYNPFEAVKTNILGAQNVINVAIDKGVKRVIALSTDKAANPVNLYGATKLCAEKLFVAGNSYVRRDETMFGVVRYGNVVGSRGSVGPLFLKQRASGVLTVTDERMTRFWITLQQGVDFVLRCLENMCGGEIFVPHLPSIRVADMARAVCPDCRIEYVGIRPGEKIHELMVTRDESRNTLAFDDFYLIQPQFRYWTRRVETTWQAGRPLPDGFEYNSGTNDWFLSVDEIAAYFERNTH